MAASADAIFFDANMDAGYATQSSARFAAAMRASLDSIVIGVAPARGKRGIEA